jgi:hypothetical protein
MQVFNKFLLAALATVCLTLAPAHAAQTTSLGMILDSQGGRIGSAPASAGSSIYVGDILSTDTDGSLTVRIGQTTYQLLGDTSAAFYPGQTSPIAELRRGTMAVSNNSDSQAFEIFAADVKIVSGATRPIQGEVSLKSLCELVVKAREGVMDVVAGSEKRTVDQQHAYRVIPEHSVEKIRDPVSPEDPNYHKNHSHTACAVATTYAAKGAPIPQASSHFAQVALGAAAVVTVIGVSKAYESPDRP